MLPIIDVPRQSKSDAWGPSPTPTEYTCDGCGSVYSEDAATFNLVTDGGTSYCGDCIQNPVGADLAAAARQPTDEGTDRASAAIGDTADPQQESQQSAEFDVIYKASLAIPALVGVVFTGNQLGLLPEVGGYYLGVPIVCLAVALICGAVTDRYATPSETHRLVYVADRLAFGALLLALAVFALGLLTAFAPTDWSVVEWVSNASGWNLTSAR